MSALDSVLVGKFHSEYLTLINRYKDLRRNSIFCRYYNINENASSDLNTISFGKFGTYDIYDYTPLFHIDTISDSTQENIQTSGFKFDSEFSLNTYTITTPKVNDVIVFPYESNNKNLIYRVKAITTNLNAITENIKFHTQLFNHYVYLITEGKNVTKQFYIDFLSDLNNMKVILQSSKFDESLEYYTEYDFNENIIIFKFLNRFDIYFFNIKKPFMCIGKDTEVNYKSNNELIVLMNKYHVEFR